MRFGTYPLVNQKLCFRVWLPLHHNGLVQHPRYCWRHILSPVHLTFFFNITHEQEPEILKMPRLGYKLIPNPLCSVREQWPQTWSSWLSSQLLHRLPQDQRSQHNHIICKKAEVQFWGSQTGLPSKPDCTLTSCPWCPKQDQIQLTTLAESNNHLKHDWLCCSTTTKVTLSSLPL